MVQKFMFIGKGIKSSMESLYYEVKPLYWIIEMSLLMILVINIILIQLVAHYNSLHNMYMHITHMHVHYVEYIILFYIQVPVINTSIKQSNYWYRICIHKWSFSSVITNTLTYKRSLSLSHSIRSSAPSLMLHDCILWYHVHAYIYKWSALYFCRFTANQLHFSMLFLSIYIYMLSLFIILLSIVLCSTLSFIICISINMCVIIIHWFLCSIIVKCSYVYIHHYFNCRYYLSLLC